MGLFGDGGSSNDLNSELGRFRAIDVPTASDMRIKLEQLVAAGVLTPEQAQTYLQDPNAMDQISLNPEDRGSQVDAMNAFKQIAEQGGSDAGEKADLNNIFSQLASTDKGQRDSILQAQAQRGALTSGMTLAAQLAATQGNAAQANQLALGSNAAAEARKADALKNVASIGSGLESQDYQHQAAKAAAQNAINQFNTQQKTNTNQFNINNANQAQQLNLANAQNLTNANTNNQNDNAKRNSELIQQEFNNKLAKESASSNVTNALANSDANAASSQNAFAGNLLGTVGGVIGGIYGGPGGAAAGKKGGEMIADDGSRNAAHGMMVPGKARVPGDSEANDTVPARLSPGEVVLPRSVVHDPHSVMAFLHRMKQQKQAQAPAVHPHDIAATLAALTKMRNGDNPMCMGGEVR